MQCTVSKDVKPQNQVRMEVTFLKPRFSNMTIYVQLITPKHNRGNMKFVAMVVVFTRYVWAVSAPVEKAETIAKVLIDGWIPIFGPIDFLVGSKAEYNW